MLKSDAFTTFDNFSQARKIIKSILGRTLYPVLIPRAIRKVNRVHADSIEEWTDLALNFRYGLPIKGLFIHFKPMQVRSEILGLLKTLQPRKPRIVCEIGTSSGGTLFLFSRIASYDAKLISIDMPWGKFGSGYVPAQIPLFQSFARKEQKVFLLREDSHSQHAVGSVERVLNGDKIDFLLIDGDHTYDGVKQDFRAYSGLVKDGGLIAFHDIVPGPPKTVGGVRVFWEEIKGKYEHKELVDDWKQGGFGLGLIFWKSE